MPRNNQKARKRLRVKAGAKVRVSDLAAKYPDFLRLMRARDGRTFWELSANLRVDCGAMLYLDSAPIISKKGFHIDACSQSLLSADGGKVQRKLVTPLDPQGSPLKHEWLSDLVSVASLSEGNGAPVIMGVSQDAFIPHNFFGINLHAPSHWTPEGWEVELPDEDEIVRTGQLAFGRVFAHLRANSIMTVRINFNPWIWEFGDRNARDRERSKREFKALFRAFLCAVRDYGIRPQMNIYLAPPDKYYPWTRYTRNRSGNPCPDDPDEEREVVELSRLCQGGKRRYTNERDPDLGPDDPGYDENFPPYKDVYPDVPQHCIENPESNHRAFDSRICSDEFDNLARVVVEMIDEAINVLGSEREIDLELCGEFEICCIAETSGWDGDACDLAVLTRLIWRALHCDPANPRSNVRYLGPSSATGRQFFKNDPKDVADKGRSDYCMWMTRLFCYSNEVLNSRRSIYDPPEGVPIPRRIYFDAISMNAYYRDSDPTVPAPRGYDNNPRLANDFCWRPAWHDPESELGKDPSDQLPSCSGPRATIEGMHLLIQLISQRGNWPGGAALPMYITEQGSGHKDEFGAGNGQPAWGDAKGFANQKPDIWEPVQAVFDVCRQAEFLTAPVPLRGITNFVYGRNVTSEEDFRFCTKTRGCDPGPPYHAKWWYPLGKYPFDYPTEHPQERTCEGYAARIAGTYQIPEGNCRSAQGIENPEQKARRLWECYEFPSFKALSVQAKLLIGKRFSAAEQLRLLCDHDESNINSNPLCSSFEDERQGTRWIREPEAGALRPYAHSFCLQSKDDEGSGKGVYVQQINRRGWKDSTGVSYMTKNALQADVHHVDRRLEAHDLVPEVRGGRLRFWARNLPLDVGRYLQEDSDHKVWCWAPDVIWVEELPRSGHIDGWKAVLSPRPFRSPFGLLPHRG